MDQYDYEMMVHIYSFRLLPVPYLYINYISPFTHKMITSHRFNFTGRNSEFGVALCKKSLVILTRRIKAVRLVECEIIETINSNTPIFFNGRNIPVGEGFKVDFNRSQTAKLFGDIK